MKTITAKTIEYRIERTTRKESYKGKFNCEIFINGSYAGDRQGDTAQGAKALAESAVRGWVKQGTVIDAR